MIEDAVTQLRGRLFGAVDPDLTPPEARLEKACSRGRGHMLITGENRAEIDLLLRRVLDKVDPLAMIRTNADEAENSIDYILTAVLGASEEEGEQDFSNRRTRVLDLLARAQEADRSVFFVVDSADDCNLGQLEKLCKTLDVGPDAAKRLRVVMVGDAGFREKIELREGRNLCARIGAYIHVGDPTPLDSTPAPTTIGITAEHIRPRSSRMWTLATAAAVAFSLTVYASAFLFTDGSSTNYRVDGDVSRAVSEAMQVAIPSRSMAAPATSIRGDEPFLRTPLAIRTMATPKQRFAIAAKPAKVTPPSKQASGGTAAKKPSASTAAKATTPKSAAPNVKTAPPAAGAQSDTSIDAFMDKFR